MRRFYNYSIFAGWGQHFRMVSNVFLIRRKHFSGIRENFSAIPGEEGLQSPENYGKLFMIM